MRREEKEAFLPDGFMDEMGEGEQGKLVSDSVSAEDLNLDLDLEADVEAQVLSILFDNIGRNVGDEIKQLKPKIGGPLKDAQKLARESRKAARNANLPEEELDPENAAGSYADDIPAGISGSKLASFFKQARGGVPLNTALQFARIPVAQAKVWFERGARDPNSWYGKLLEEYEYSKALWEVKHIQQLQRKAKSPNNWKLNLELLKIQRADNWAPEMKPPAQNTPNTNVLVINQNKEQLSKLDALSLEDLNSLVEPTPLKALEGRE